MSHQITIYTSSLCSVCPLVRSFFTMLELPFTEINVDFRPVERTKLIVQTKKLAVPQTNINGQWVTGFHPEKFFTLLNE